MSESRNTLRPGRTRGRDPERGIMSKVANYYSTNPSDPDVYHDHDNCPTGQQIPSYNKAYGTNGYRKCKQCTDLG